MAESESIPMEGVLDCVKGQFDLPDLLMHVSRSGKSGRLRFSNPEGDKALDVREGKFVFAKSSSPDDGLGQYLLRHGKVPLVDYDRISKEVRPGKRLGSLLVKEGILDASDLVPAVVGQVRQVILSLFRYIEMSYAFQEAPLDSKERITLNLPISDLIIDGIQEVHSWRRVAKGAGGVRTAYKVTGKRSNKPLSLSHNEEVNELLEIVTTTAIVGEICNRSKLGDFSVCRYLWAFQTLGWIERVDLSLQEKTVIDVGAEDSNLMDVSAHLEPVVDETDQARTQVDVAAQERTVVDVAQKAAKLADLEKTVVDTSAAPPPAPKPIPEELMRTQLAVEPKEEPAPEAPLPESAWTTEPSEYDPQRTRVFDDPPALTPPPASKEPEIPLAPSAGERMESILEEGSDSKNEPKPGDDSTQIFDSSSALPEPASKQKPKPKPKRDDAATQLSIDPPAEKDDASKES